MSESVSLPLVLEVGRKEYKVEIDYVLEAGKTATINIRTYEDGELKTIPTILVIGMLENAKTFVEMKQFMPALLGSL